jgi:hypothetical protein
MDGWPGAWARVFLGMMERETESERTAHGMHACVPVDTTGRGFCSFVLGSSSSPLHRTGTDAEACKPARHNDRANTSGSGAFDRSGGPPSAPPGSVAPRRDDGLRSDPG